MTVIEEFLSIFGYSDNFLHNDIRYPTHTHHCDVIYQSVKINQLIAVISNQAREGMFEEFAC